MSLPTDQILQNRYHVVSLLGRGGRGAVYCRTLEEHMDGIERGLLP